MDLKKEYASLVAGAKRHVELFYHAGVYDFALPPRPPKPDDCPDKWAVTEGEPAPCTVHGGFAGWSLAFRVIGGGGLAIAYTFQVSDERPGHAADEAGQIEKIISWLTAELKAGEQGSFTITAYRCAGAGIDGEGLKAALPLAEEKLKALSPKAIVLMGGGVAGLFLNNEAGRLRGRLHEIFGIKAAATWGIDELVKNPDLKKQALGDFKMALSVVSGT